MKSRRSAPRIGILRGIAAVSALLIGIFGWAQSASAFPQYSLNHGDASNCAECHGNFRAPAYISLTDGLNWGNIHDLHRNTMLSGDCNTCHYGATRFPVYTEHSNGGTGLAAISCVGCHGRAEDNVEANPEVAAGRSGYGAGLRQHHFTAGVETCAQCHLDADPAGYTTVGEDVLPVYYADPGTGHPDMPDDACNADGSEDFAGIPEGLDNDGDNIYDMNDSDCSTTGVDPVVVTAPAAVLLPNQPNPFRAETSIGYRLSQPATIDLRIIDIHGRRVRCLDAQGSPGLHRIAWDGRNDSGREMPSGIYFCELRTEDVRARRAIVLIR
jgi:hypothetical protein